MLCVIALSCRKSSGPQVTLTGALTNCQGNSVCTYSYYEHAHFTGTFPQLAAGSDRVFAYKSADSSLCDYSILLDFETSLSDNDFDITASQIAAGHAIYAVSCPCCDFGYDPNAIGGEIKGKKIDDSHWLINATVIVGGPSNKPVDTLVVNQYFAVQKLP